MHFCFRTFVFFDIFIVLRYFSINGIFSILLPRHFDPIRCDARAPRGPEASFCHYVVGRLVAETEGPHCGWQSPSVNRPLYALNTQSTILYNKFICVFILLRLTYIAPNLSMI